MTTEKLKADKRKLFGRKVKQLRKEGILPANLFGKKIDSISIQIDETEFRNVFSEAGETGIVEITVDKKTYPVLVQNVQVDPVDARYLHVDFMHVDLKEKVTAQVPLEFVGESPAEKEGNVVVQYMDEVEVEALPADLPERIEVDISKLTKVDEQISLGDLKTTDKYKIVEDIEQLVAKVEEPKKEEEVVPVAEESQDETEVADESKEKPQEDSSEEAEE